MNRREFFVSAKVLVVAVLLSRCGNKDNITGPSVVIPSSPSNVIANPFNSALVAKHFRSIKNEDSSATTIFDVLSRNNIMPTSEFVTYSDASDGNKIKRDWLITGLNGHTPDDGWVIILNGYHYFANHVSPASVLIPAGAKVDIYYAKLWDGKSP